MKIIVTANAGGVRIENPGEFSSLSVEIAEDLSGAEAQHELGPLGRLDGDHVWLDRDRLRALVVPVGDEALSSGFDRMVDYAVRSGWTSSDGTQIRSHITPSANEAGQ